jgi:hypothetical protein
MRVHDFLSLFLVPSNEVFSEIRSHCIVIDSNFFAVGHFGNTSGKNETTKEEERGCSQEVTKVTKSYLGTTVHARALNNTGLDGLGESKRIKKTWSVTGA